MSTQTPNLNLTKQDGNENPSRTALNGNWDIIDSVVQDLQDAIANANALLGALGVDSQDNPLVSKAEAVQSLISGQALTPASVTATGKVKAATIEDSGGTLAALRESVSNTIKIHSSVKSAKFKANQGSDLWQIEYYDTNDKRFVLFADSVGIALYDESAGTTRRARWS